MMRSTLAITLFVALHAVAGATNDCRLCDDLKKVQDSYRVTVDVPEAQYIPLQNKATSIIQKMPDKNGKLTESQIREIVAVIRLAAPPDPAEAILVNNIDIIDKNKAAFEKEIAKLPKEEKQEIEIGLLAARGRNPDELPSDKPKKK